MKQIALFVLIAITSVSCSSKNKEPDKEDSGCGCHAKENALDLHGTTETNRDVLGSPTVKL